MHTGASLWCKAVAESLPCVHQGELGSSCNYPWAPSQKVRITFCLFFLQPYLILFDSCSRRHVQHVHLSWISLWIWGFWSSLQIGPKWCWKSPSSMQALYKLNVVTHVPIFGSPVLVGKSKGNRFTAVCRCYIYIWIYQFLFFDFVGGGCSASAGLSDSSTGPVVDAQRESLRGLKRKRFEWFEVIWMQKGNDRN